MSEGFQKTLEMEKTEGGKSDGGTSECTKYPGWKAMPYVIGNETFEKLSAIGTYAGELAGISDNSIPHQECHCGDNDEHLQWYHKLDTTHRCISQRHLLGPLRHHRLWFDCVFSDDFLHKTIIAYFYALTAAVRTLHPPPCTEINQGCRGPTISQLSVLISAFVLFAIGAGGIRPCNLAFGADQFNPKTESGRRDITSFFNWYYFTFTVAIMISCTLIIYVQSNVSWSIGLAIPAVLMLLSCIIFFVGTRLYVRVKPEGSPFTSFAQVLIAATKKRQVKLPELPEKKVFDPPLHSSLVTRLPHTNQFKFLDKATVITSKDEIKSNGKAADPWRLCTLQQVEMVKCFVRIIPVWTSGIMFAITLTQQSTYIVYQALQMDRQLGKSGFKIPAGSFVVFNMLTLSLWVPIYDRLVVPQLRKITKHDGGITVLQRIGVGIVISIFGTLVSALVEQRRRETALHKPTLGLTLTGEGVSSMSSLWLLPQLMLFGLSEAFTAIGQTEFYYQQFPENMRSVGGAVSLLGSSVGSYVSGTLVTIVHNVTGRNGNRNWLAQDLNEGRLDLFYMMIAGAATLNFVYFIICAKWYRVKGTADSVNPKVVSERKEENNLSV